MKRGGSSFSKDVCEKEELNLFTLFCYELLAYQVILEIPNGMAKDVSVSVCMVRVFDLKQLYLLWKFENAYFTALIGFY
jgi:hypothetical protein